VVTDTQWVVFCKAFDEPELAADPRLRSNGDRVKQRAWLIPRLGETLKRYTRAELAARLEDIGLPFAPIAKPWDLLSDPHLNASGGLMTTQLPDGKVAHIPALPIALDGARLPKRADPPKVGEHTRALLAAAGLGDADIDALFARRVVA